MSNRYRAALEAITRVQGIRGAMIVAAADGVVVAESLMEDLEGQAVAALTASLAGRLGRVTEAAGRGAPAFIHAQASNGAILITPCGPELLIVVVAERNVNAGLARLEMFRASERIA